jgi:hypothetical protein
LLHILIVYVINDFMTKQTPRFRGPSLIWLAIVYILISEAGFVAAMALRHGAAFVTPFGSAEALHQFLALSPTAVRVSNFFLFGSALPFGIFAVTTVSRLRFLGVRAAGTNIALLGGIIATIALLLSGAVGWILSVPEVLDSASAMKAIVFLNFLLGGTVFAVGFGLLAAGVSVTSHFMRLTPRWMVALGMLVAIAGELSSLSLIAYPANFFIPVTRFVGFIWMISVAVGLTKSRKSTPATNAADPSLMATGAN